MKKVMHRSHERKIAFLVLAIAASAGLVLALVLLFASRSHTFRLVGGSTMYYVDNEIYYLSGEPVIYNSKEYVPVDDLLKHCGYTTYYNTELHALAISDRDGKSYIYTNSDVITYHGENIHFSDKSIAINDIMYVTKDMLAVFTDSKIVFEGSLTEVWIPE
ncbi:MAG: hypothetical protein J1G06_01455 [Oscillospiraceae bacterium]|nr:hypothetical protein [Oscillospiraceae bacterium]